MNIAIIPARGGSKRIPHKNIKNFCGKPIIAYSIEAAIASGFFEKVIVSTDDQKIAEIAISYGAEVPFFRPTQLANDYAGTVEVIRHAINELALSDDTNICCLYATAPFVGPKILLDGLKLLESKKFDYVFSATEFPFPIQRAFHLQDNGKIQMFHPELSNSRSQDLPKAYHDAGQFYWGKAKAFKEGKAIFSEHSKAVLLPRKRVQDIDTPEDWELAEALFSVL